MNYHLHRDGQNLGIFPLEDLRRWRQSGRLNGEELVWCAGMSGWQPLDSVLQRTAPGQARATPPPLPGSKSRAPVALIVVAIVGSILFLLATAAVGVFAARNVIRSQSASRPARQWPPESAVDLASKPVGGNTNALTWADARKQNREFYLRQYLDGYEKRGQRNPACDGRAIQLIQSWTARNYGLPGVTNLPGPVQLGDELATNPACTDPVVLTAAGVNAVEWHEAVRRLERAVGGFENSKHKAFPKWFATVTLAGKLNDDPARVAKLDAAALPHFKESFADGSFTPGDQPIIADILVLEWGNGFFKRNAAAIVSAARDAGKSFQWLALTLEGERQINEAWKARGDGEVNTVTAEGWQGFYEHLSLARKNLTEAWQLRPELPLAADRMMTVALGNSGLAEMRLWFDRTVAAQMDYPQAWSEMRWGLRPRWYGSRDAMRAFGVMAIDTGRFDTDVPRTFFDVVTDLESELKLPPGQHIYGREDIWPDLQRMYDGYLAAPSRAASRDSWRSSYAVVAYLAGKYDVARTQLEALNWQPQPDSLQKRGADLSLMPLEVAARTGPCREPVAAAEDSRNDGDIAGALKIYTGLMSATNADVRTKEFARCRSASLRMEQRLQTGAWVDFLPQSDDDPNWAFVWGKPHRLADGTLEVQSGEEGHLFYSHARIGTDFEVKGEFEPVRSSSKDFQAGLVMGMPDSGPQLNTFDWYGFRVKHTAVEGQIASFSIGWTRRHFTQPIPVNTGTNTFFFRWQGGKVTASVNGREVFHKAEPPRAIRVAQDDFLLGLGAFNDNNETVIRYRNIQVRKLSSPAE
jgi:hypothetical protein